MSKKEYEKLKKLALETLERNVDKAAEVLVSLLNSENEEVRLRAATAILERVLGKPTQYYQHK